jgi:ubiquinone/menaquinone biosynthesis C-methylase UbiE
MNCDTIAGVYRWLEYIAFGSTLQRRRCEFLDALGTARTALVIGDGDGRFLAELHKRYPDMEVDSIDLSAGMIAMARRRIDSCRVRLLEADARTIDFPRDEYDLVVTHFFLDCFSEADAAAVIRRASSVTAGGRRWIISEFRIPASGWKALHARLWLKTMYLFFRMTTGLSTDRLPRYHEILRAYGFTLEREVTERFGLVASECWIKDRK